MKKLRVIAIATTLALLAMHANGESLLEVGDTFPEFSAKDQHDQAYQFEAGTTTVIVTFGMKSAKRANKFLGSEDPRFLQDNQAVYISDIYEMPGIGRMFAIPKMKKYPHRIILADTEHLLDAFPQQEGRVTIFHLKDNAVIESIQFWNPKESLLTDYLD